MPIVEIPIVNILTNRANVWVKDEDWARVSPASWEKNFKTGFKSDGDKFSTNFLGHPVHGSWYFNSARSSGNSFWSSLPYTVGGSLMWEFLGETEAASEIDINTTCFGGVFLGELTHRISRHLLSNDRKRSNRFLRNFSAFALNPMGVINGALYPELRQKLTAPVSGHFPIRSQLSLGINFPVGQISDDHATTRMHLSYDLIYGTLFDGDPGFNPFDFFVFRTWADLGLLKANNPFLFNISAHAPLVRWALKDGLAVTISQHYDFLKNQIFELGNLSITGDLYYRLNIDDRQWMFSAKAVLIPFGSTTSQVTTYLIAEGLLSPNRNYLYGAGLALESQVSLRFKNMARMSLKYNQWMIYPRREARGTERSHIVYFHNTFPLGTSHSLTFEIYHYFKKASYNDLPGFGNIRKQYTEFRFMGNYNF
ncbi:MAG: DUF3943 domain-containing protein [Saprospiraceae bacterium]|nr:DUF3943 domain-containing protein [Saprospiraceae bacterium]